MSAAASISGNTTARSSRTARKTAAEITQMHNNVNSLMKDLSGWLQALKDYETAGKQLAEKGEGLVNMLLAVKNKLPELKDWQEAHATASDLPQAGSSSDPVSQAQPKKTDEELRKAVLQQVDTVNNVVAALKRVEGMKGSLVKQTQVMLTAPMTAWMEAEIKPTLGKSDELEAIDEKIKKTNKSLSKYAKKNTQKLSSKSQFRKREMEGQLHELQTRYKEIQINYILGLEDVESKAFFNLAQYLNAFMFANLSFFRQGKNVLKKLENDLRAAAKGLQGEEDSQIKKQEEQKTQLLSILKKQQEAGESSQPTDEKQGFLEYNRKPCWFSVYKGAFLWYKKPSDDIPKKTIDLLLCTVKPDPTKPRTFKVIYSAGEVYELTAPSDAEMQGWVAVIQNSIQSQLETHKKLAQSQKSAQYDKALSSAGGTIGRLAPLAQLQLRDEANCKCADCDAEDPDWASINWGILMCYECSGVHRSLGTHISKVRSLTLDKWDPQTLTMMKYLGNKKVNSILEAARDPKYERPTANSDRESRAKFITLKYREKKFLEPKQTDVNQLSKDLYNAAAKMTTAETESILFELIGMLSRGANVNYVNFAEKNTTPLHFLAASGNLVGCEFIMQNDASLSVVDVKGWTPLHYAAAHDQAAVARLLINRGAILNLKDAQNMNAYEVAKQQNAQNAADLLAGAMGVLASDVSDDDD
mmetsp:Transcript_10450/g.15719  ORF Transcript_10450/g.15719 Transcript_10450/m.15719 type:complete len:699 (+) Transcript_10450:14-2110(+)